MFAFMAWVCSLPRTGKALVNVCGLTLQTRWRENAPKRENFNCGSKVPYYNSACKSGLAVTACVDYVGCLEKNGGKLETKTKETLLGDIKEKLTLRKQYRAPNYD